MTQRPLPASIYWRRRLLLVAVAIALVWVLIQVVGAVAGGSDPEPKAAPATAKPEPTATSGIVPVSLAASNDRCDPERVRVTPTVKQGQLNRGAVKVSLVVSTTATQACTLQPKDADLIAVVSANDTPIWDSTLCESGLLTEPVTLSPRWATVVETEWSGRVSGSRCGSNEAWASPGSYRLQVGTLGGEPGATTFKLGERPQPPKKPTPTKSATPTKTPSPTKTPE